MMWYVGIGGVKYEFSATSLQNLISFNFRLNYSISPKIYLVNVFVLLSFE